MTGFRVLIVDDNLPVRQLLCELLAERCPYLEPTVVADGEAALAAHVARPFDLIVTDYQMPQLDGLGLVRCRRAGRDGTPIILMSAHQHIGPIALAAGANGVLAKPFALTQLASMIDVLAHQGS